MTKLVYSISAAAAAKSRQSCPTLCDPVSDSVWPHRWQPTRLPHPWDSPGKNTGVGCHFLLHCMKGKVKVKSLSRVQLLVTPWTAAHQAPPSMGFSRQEYWSGLPLPSPTQSLKSPKQIGILLLACWFWAHNILKYFKLLRKIKPYVKS